MSINVGGQDVIKFLFQHQANKIIVINSQNIWKRLPQTKVNKHMDDLQLLAFLKMMCLIIQEGISAHHDTSRLYEGIHRYVSPLLMAVI